MDEKSVFSVYYENSYQFDKRNTNKKIVLHKKLHICILLALVLQIYSVEHSIPENFLWILKFAQLNQIELNSYTLKWKIKTRYMAKL